VGHGYPKYVVRNLSQINFKQNKVQTQIISGANALLQDPKKLALFQPGLKIHVFANCFGNHF